MKRLAFLIPLMALAALATLLGRGLDLNPKEVPSPLIGKPAPEFKLTRLEDAATTVTPADLRQSFNGRAYVVNVWASWCAPCLEEHPVITDWARRSGVPIVGLNHKDSRDNASRWLARHGNPYRVNVWDGDGRASLDWGVYGVPETFVIDAAGVVRFKHVGPVTPKVLAERIAPLMKALDG